MILWFVGGACVLVWFVFSDPRIDYRLVAAGALLPDLPLRLTPLHSVAAPAVVLVVVMLASRRGSTARRRLLALPIGMLLHLVLDGAFTRADVLVWPRGTLPSLDRSVAVVALQEVAGAVGLAWTWLREARAAC